MTAPNFELFEEELYLTETRSLHDGVQRRYVFPNGFGASVVRHSFSYGSEQGLWELAVTDENGKLTYDTPITDDVIGHLDDDAVHDLLAAIAHLTPGETRLEPSPPVHDRTKDTVVAFVEYLERERGLVLNIAGADVGAAADEFVDAMVAAGKAVSR